MKKIKFLLPVVAAVAGSHAATINFEASSTGNVGQGGFVTGDSIVAFYDTIPGSGVGASPRIVNGSTAATGTPTPSLYVPLGNRALANENGTDSSALLMVFTGPVDFSSISFSYNRDTATNPWGRLRVYDNLSGSTINSTFLAGINSGSIVPNAVVYNLSSDNTASTFESIGYNGEFDIAVFDIGYKDGNGNFVSATTLGNELIDNLSYVALPQGETAPVPEVQTYAGIFGAALAGVEMLRRRRAARA